MDKDSKQKRRILIVGGVAGGASAATRARRVNADAEIVLLEKGPAVSFANCGLPYHIGGEIESREKLLVVTPELFRKRFGIDVRTSSEAISIERQAKSVQVRTSDGSTESLTYDKLILSPGAKPIVPPFAEQGLTNVCTLWSLADMDRIIATLDATPDSKAVVIGGGFVGIEVAEQLAHRGVACTLVERNAQVLKTLDPEMARPIQDELQRHGVTLRLSTNVTGLESSGKSVTAVQLGDESLPADLVVMAIGIRPRTELAVQAGLEIGPAGGIRVDDQMRTSDPDIFAVGDCVEYEHRVLGHPSRVPLAGPANRAGRIAGTVAAGAQSAPMKPVCGTSVVRVFDMTAANTGLTAAQCRTAAIQHRSIYIQAADHASYFPGAEGMTLKLIYCPDGRIVGAQGVGGQGVDKRIDVIATIISMGGSVDDLAGLDLAYAPPFGSAKDPVHMAAFVASNDLQSCPAIIPPDCDLSSSQVVDVRTDAELQKLPLAGAIHMPIDDLLHRLDELDPAKPTITFCHSGKRAHIAASILQASGFKHVRNATGGMLVRSRFEAMNH